MGSIPRPHVVPLFDRVKRVEKWFRAAYLSAKFLLLELFDVVAPWQGVRTRVLGRSGAREFVALRMFGGVGRFDVDGTIGVGKKRVPGVEGYNGW